MKTHFDRLNRIIAGGKSRKMLVVSVAVFLFISTPLLSSGNARLAYYRQKDPAVEWVNEKIYQISHRDARSEVKIVCLGDSMTGDLPEQPIINRFFILRPNWIQMVQGRLRDAFPDQRIFVFNHGARSKDISTALARMEDSFEAFDNYHKRSITLRSVREIDPDIIILESHAYMDRETGYPEYAEIVKQIVALATEEIGAEVFFLATISPDKEDFRILHSKYEDDPQRRAEEAHLICRRLEDFIQLGQEAGIPIIDVYHGSLKNPREYIKKDMVHPSYEGHKIIAERVFSTIKSSARFAAGNAPSATTESFELGKG